MTLMPFSPLTSLAPVTVTVSGTVAVSAASLPLPTGAATEATLAAEKLGMDDVALTAILQREALETTA